MPVFLFNRMCLHYIEGGTGLLIVLLPGNTASSAHLADDMGRLVSRYRVVALDLPGTGRSDRMASGPLTGGGWGRRLPLRSSLTWASRPQLLSGPAGVG